MTGEPRLKTRRKESRNETPCYRCAAAPLRRYANDASVAEATALIRAYAAEQARISTETARRFYLSNGYNEDGRPYSAFGMDFLYPLAKSLVGPTRYVANEWRPGMGQSGVLDLEGGSTVIFERSRE